MTKGYFYAHQGWTDIINCFPLINYYSKKYDKLICFYRQDSYELVSYYISQFNNVFFESDKLIPHKIDGDILFHGIHDCYRNDRFKNAFAHSSQMEHFVSRFYNLYDIPYYEIINNFDFKRNIELEEIEYQKFIQQYGINFILYHEPSYYPINLRIDNSNLCQKINLDGRVNNIFSYIKILQNSKELHLVDSTWASMCYLLDAKYQMFKNKKIFLYPYERSGGLLKDKNQTNLNPINLRNWIIVN
jgi:hypothetical protein